MTKKPARRHLQLDTTIVRVLDLQLARVRGGTDSHPDAMTPPHWTITSCPRSY